MAKGDFPTGALVEVIREYREFYGKDSQIYLRATKELKNLLLHLVKLDISKDREKFWQEKAGRMAVIANWMYEKVDERKLSENQVEQAHEMFEEILEMLEFDE